MRNILTLLTIMVVLMPAVSMGFGGKGFADGLFLGVDLDRNDSIDRSEAKNAFNLASDEIFMRYDKDENDSINQVEFNEFIQQSPWTG